MDGRATIAKIVDFYNSQIRPPVEVYQFTHERLEDSDNIRYRSSSVFDPRFIGILISIKATSRKQKRRYAICTAAFFIINISYNFVFRGRFCKFPRYFLVHQF
jgi:hypothetical protein